MNERFRGGHANLAAAPTRHDLVMFPPYALAILTDMREESSLLLLDD